MRRKYEPDLLDSFESLRRKQARGRREGTPLAHDKVQVAYNDVSALSVFCFEFGWVVIQNLVLKKYIY